MPGPHQGWLIWLSCFLIKLLKWRKKKKSLGSMKWCDYSWSVTGHLILWSLWIWVTDFDSAQKSQPGQGMLFNSRQLCALFGFILSGFTCSRESSPPQIHCLISDVCRLGVTNSWYSTAQDTVPAITIVSRYSGSAITSTMQESNGMIHLGENRLLCKNYAFIHHVFV